MSVSAPCISVVIPTYNRVWALPRTVRQFYGKPLVAEVIVVDDGSTDGAREWLKQETAAQPVLRVVFHERNRGANASRNDGVRAATSEYVMLWDDDMLLEPPNGLEILLSELERLGGDVIAPAFVVPEGQGCPEAGGPAEASRSNAMLDRWLLITKPWKELVPVMPRCTFESPMLCGITLQSREWLLRVPYDEGLGFSSYRDETDRHFSMLALGAKLLACPMVCAVDLDRPPVPDGGCRARGFLLSYQMEACRNNWRLLRRHRKVIREVLGISVPIHLLQAVFVARALGYAMPKRAVGDLLRRMGVKRWRG